MLAGEGGEIPVVPPSEAAVVQAIPAPLDRLAIKAYLNRNVRPRFLAESAVVCRFWWRFLPFRASEQAAVVRPARDPEILERVFYDG